MRNFIATVVVIAVSIFLVACVAPVEDASSMVGKCPQPRFTEKAPAAIYSLKNPLPNSGAVLDAGEDLYMGDAAQVACVECHGKRGEGRGVMASMFDPPPRNFCCAKTIEGVPDGQLFWIIKNGSPGTSMPPFKHLSDEKIWQLVHYIRHLSRYSNL